MHRIDSTNNVDALPATTAGINPPGFFKKNPDAGGGTVLDPDWANTIQEELAGVVTAAGIGLDKANRAQVLAALRVLFGGVGQFQLQYTNNAQITLAPVNGSGIRVAGKSYIIGAGGIAIPNVGVEIGGVAAQNLAASTVYLVYVKDNGAGVLIPSFWPVADGHMPDTTAGNIGVEVRRNPAGGGVPDTTRTLVGMIATDGANHFSDFLTLSWFSRRDQVQRTNFSSDPSTSSNGVLVELSSSIRNGFLVWAGEKIAYAFSGTATLSVGNDVAHNAVAFDGTAPEREGAMYEGFTGSTSGNMAFTGSKSGLSEGLHYATVVGMFGIAGGGGAGTATWTGGTATTPSNPPAVLQIKVRG